MGVSSHSTVAMVPKHKITILILSVCLRVGWSVKPTSCKFSIITVYFVNDESNEQDIEAIVNH